MVILALALIVSGVACLSIGVFWWVRAWRMPDKQLDESFSKLDRSLVALIWCLVASALGQAAAIVAKFG